jgi:hypothetical protein
MLNSSQMSDEQLVEAFQAGHVAELCLGRRSGAVWRVSGPTKTHERPSCALRGLKASRRRSFSPIQDRLNLSDSASRRKSYVSLDEPEPQIPPSRESPPLARSGTQLAERVRSAIRKSNAR